MALVTIVTSKNVDKKRLVTYIACAVIRKSLIGPNQKNKSEQQFDKTPEAQNETESIDDLPAGARAARRVRTRL